MATAAPAATAPVAPAPAESAAPPQATAPAPGPDTKVVLKPIPPRTPKLPGVLEDGPEDASTRPTRARDEGGRFARETSSEPGIVAKPKPSAVDAADGIPDLPNAEPPKPKFKFAGKEYDSAEAAEAEYKSIMGRVQPTQRKLAETEGKLVKAAESARGWHSEAQRLAARVAEMEAGGSQTAPSPTPEIIPQQGIDWGLYAEIRKVANEAGTPEKADQWLQEQYDAGIRAEIARLREEAIENPRREAEQQAQLESTANTLVESMAAHTNPDGSPAFPEFRDGNQAREVGALWNSLGLDPQLALTPGGAVAAVALYRMARSMDSLPAAQPPTPAPATPMPPSPAAVAAASLEGGRPLAPAAADTRHADPAVARLVAGLRNRELIRPGLGFEA